MSRSGTSHTNWLIILLISVALLTVLFFTIPQFRKVQADTASTTDLAVLRENLLADPTSVSGNWLRTLNPIVKDVQGDIVWNNTQQQGVLRIRDLPKPKAGTFYQLWLYDARNHAGEGIAGSKVEQGTGHEALLTLIKTDTLVQEPYKFEFKLQTAEGAHNGQILLMVQP
ncbi:hypothetical protein SAMN05660964_01749 [Thiothrix caldifontis]|uniref:Anti-sigma K factor RskA C-terminal domain-containing protein n=1 Tax=Thiothrix caldifontis TaxID=525918 RepID=A0A1H4BQJ5_9GAMM|nr:hypothetical protein SAMN05660964_01749 [Thiothrix caldifontis]